MTTLEKETLKETFKELNLSPPSQKDEDWLYYNLDDLLESSQSSGTKSNTLENDLLTGYYLYFKNGHLIKKNLPPEISYKKSSITPNKTNNGFIHLAAETFDTSHLIITNSTTHIKIIYESDEGFNSTGISVTATNSILTLEKIFITKENSTSNNYTKIKASKNSTLLINEVNIENKGNILDFVDTSLEENCHLVGLNQSYLSNNSRFQNRVFINGNEATARLNGLGINQKDKQCFYNTHVYHNAGNTESHQLFKSINKNNALFEYNGKVSVKKDAQQINSYQLNQNILLDEFATMDQQLAI